MAKRQTTFIGLPADTIIEVVAYTPDNKSYIFEMKFSEWLTMNKKPGVSYRPFAKGFYNSPEVIRTEYKPKQ